MTGGASQTTAGPAPAGSGRADAGPAAGAPGYSPRRTLPFAVEVVRQLRRRRTMVAFGILIVLPWILVGAFEISGGPSPDSQTPGLVAYANTGGLNFAGFSFFVSASFLLVVVVALFCGDTVATEASWSSLRYLLAAPVPRARLLRQKLAVALAYSTVGVTTFPLMSLIAGTAAFGWHPLRRAQHQRGCRPAGNHSDICPGQRDIRGWPGVPALGVDRLAAWRGRRRGRAGHRQHDPRSGNRAR
jgi:hypothetical protein